MADYKYPAKSITLSNVRISFPTLFTPRANPTVPGSKPAYSTTFIVAKNTPQAKELMDFRAAYEKAAAPLPPGSYMAIEDGDTMFNTRPEYAGSIVVRARRTPNPADMSAPNVVDRMNRAIPAAQASELYAGCYVNAKVFVHGTDTGGKKLCCKLNGVQKFSDGERLTADNAQFGPIDTVEESNDCTF